MDATTEQKKGCDPIATPKQTERNHSNGNDSQSKCFDVGIPSELKSLDQWVCWSGNPSLKEPLHPSGYNAKNNDPSTWSSYSECRERTEHIGFVFSRTDNLIGIDLDSCRYPDGRLTKWATKILDRFQSYAEVSPSQTGVKIFCTTAIEKPTDYCKQIFDCELDPGGVATKLEQASVEKNAQVEVFYSNVYFAVTSDRVNDYEIRNCDEALEWLRENYQKEEKPKEAKPKQSTSTNDATADRMKIAMQAMLNIPKKAVEHDGSSRLIQCCGRCKWAGLNESETIQAIRSYAGMFPFPVEWSDSEITQRYNDTRAEFDGIGSKARAEREQYSKDGASNEASTDDTKPETESDLWEKIRQAYFIEPGYSLRELLDADITDNYLIENVLVERQPAEMAGIYKSLKTTIAANMALSLASGLSFLGRFRVNQRKRVLFASAESGRATLKKTIVGMAAALGDDFNRCDNMLRFEWWVPKSSNAEMLAYFVHLIDKHQADVVFLDPLYMSLDDQQASMILNGRQLAVLANEILRRGATPVFLDHVKRSSVNAKEYQPVELEDVSGAGKAEFFRQWLLIGRRQKFEAGLPNKLWLSIGGSAGHSSQWALDIDEENDQERRSYSITLQAKHEYDQGTREERQSSQVDKREAREQAANERLQRKANDLVELVMKRDPTTGMTKTQIAERLRISNQDAGRVIGILLDDGIVKSVPNSVAISGKKYDGFYLSEYMPMGGEE
jgi:AAA domain